MSAGEHNWLIISENPLITEDAGEAPHSYTELNGVSNALTPMVSGVNNMLEQTLNEVIEQYVLVENGNKYLSVEEHGMVRMQLNDNGRVTFVDNLHLQKVAAYTNDHEFELKLLWPSGLIVAIGNIRMSCYKFT